MSKQPEDQLKPLGQFHDHNQKHNAHKPSHSHSTRTAFLTLVVFALLELGVDQAAKARFPLAVALVQAREEYGGLVFRWGSAWVLFFVRKSVLKLALSALAPTGRLILHKVIVLIPIHKLRLLLTRAVGSELILHLLVFVCVPTLCLFARQVTPRLDRELLKVVQYVERSLASASGEDGPPLHRPETATP